MKKTEAQRAQFKKALATLDEAYIIYTTSDFKPKDMLRDSVVQRFEYCVDIAWKFLKSRLEEEHAVIVTSPRTAYKEAYIQKIIDDQDIWIDMVETRNMLSHMYREENSQRLIVKFAEYSGALHALI